MADSISRKLLVAEAKRRGWQVSYVGRKNYFYKITDNNGQSELFYGARPLRSSANGAAISSNKELSTLYVESLGYKVPPYLMVEPGDINEAKQFLNAHHPVVVKPLDAQEAFGVSTNIITEDQLAPAMEFAYEHSRSKRAIMQKQLDGKLYRLLIINGQLIAASHRTIPEVLGDGQHTVRQLVDILNADPRRGRGIDFPLKKITIADVEKQLGIDGLEVVPEAGKIFRLSTLGGVTAGGEAVNVTEQVNPTWAKAAGDITVPVGLFICGLDVICEDISEPVKDDYLPLLELNSFPGLQIHHFPTGGGGPIDVAARLLNEVFNIDKTT